jgi:hypothetical protein
MFATRISCLALCLSIGLSLLSWSFPHRLPSVIFQGWRPVFTWFRAVGDTRYPSRMASCLYSVWAILRYPSMKASCLYSASNTRASYTDWLSGPYSPRSTLAYIKFEDFLHHSSGWLPVFTLSNFTRSFLLDPKIRLPHKKIGISLSNFIRSLQPASDSFPLVILLYQQSLFD